MAPVSTVAQRRPWLTLLGFLLLGTWAAWWGLCFARNTLPLGAATWFQKPAFGADFWSQSDYAARLWRAGLDPYENERHLFHYPPIVIRAFLWTPFFDQWTALRIWVCILAALLGAGAFVAARTRALVGASDAPVALIAALVLLSFPEVFTLERSNFDLITLAALLAALPLFEYGGEWGEFAAGCLLAVGPWVKIYPGFIGIGLLALRRYRALVGFAVGGIGIFFISPAETLRSFAVLKIAIQRTKDGSHAISFPIWSHSLSMAWAKFADLASGTRLAPALRSVPGSVAAVLFLGPPLFWVSREVYFCEKRASLLYPFLLWITALSSFVPEIANDYSLAFLPLAAAAVVSTRDSPRILAALAISLIAFQPFAVPLPGLLLLLLKVTALVAVGASMVARARSLHAERAVAI